jgi:hypothetical protein
MPVNFNRGSFRNHGEGPYPIPVKEGEMVKILRLWKGRITEDMPVERPCHGNGWVGRIWVNDTKTNG